MKFLLTIILWCLLFTICWPVALLILLLYPLLWLLLLPFRIIGLTVEGLLKLVGAILMLPARIIRSI